MSTKVVGCALVALMACQGATPADVAAKPGPKPTLRHGNVEGVLADCEAYREAVPEAYGLCLKQGIAGLKTVDEMVSVCGLAGSWELECRAGWVDGQSRKNVSPQTLLEACGPAADCALQQLDGAPHADVLVQIERCEKYAGNLVDSCVGHALQRWALARPTPDDIAHVTSRSGKYDFQIGTFIGMVAQCQGTTTCPGGDAPLARGCAQGQRSYARDPHGCGG